MADRTLTSAVMKLTFQAALQNLMLDGAVVAAANFDGSQNQKFVEGVDDGQADRIWSQFSAALASSGTITINLLTFSGLDIGGGAGNDALGQTMDPLESICGILIKNENPADSAGVLTVEPGASNGWDQLIGTGSIEIGPQGWFVRCEPQEGSLPVASAGCNLKLVATGGPVNYSIYILGRHQLAQSSGSSSSSSSSTSSSSSSSSSTSSSSSSSSSG